MAKTAELEEFRLTSSHEHTKITTIYRATSYEKSFPGGFAVKNMPDNVGDMGSFPGLGRSWGKGNGNSLLEKNSPGSP